MQSGCQRAISALMTTLMEKVMTTLMTATWKKRYTLPVSSMRLGPPFHAAVSFKVVSDSLSNMLSCSLKSHLLPDRLFCLSSMVLIYVLQGDRPLQRMLDEEALEAAAPELKPLLEDVRRAVEELKGCTLTVSVDIRVHYCMEYMNTMKQILLLPSL